MEFDLSKPQKLLQKSARDLFDRLCPAKRVRELMATDTALHPELWSEVAEQGWLGIHLSEAAGGLGLGLVDLAVDRRGDGPRCLPGPFLGTVWAATLIAEANATSKYLLPLPPASRRGRSRCSSPMPVGIRPTCSCKRRSRQRIQDHGRKMFVSDAGVADVIVCVPVPATDLVSARRSGQVRGVRSSRPRARPTRKLYDVTFEP